MARFSTEISQVGCLVTHSEVGNVYGKRRVDAQRAVQRTQPRIRERTAGKRAMLLKQPLARRHFYECPDEHCKPRGGHNEGLDEEKPADLLWRHEHERELDEPV